MSGETGAEPNASLEDESQASTATSSDHLSVWVSDLDKDDQMKTALFQMLTLWTMRRTR